MEVVIWTKSCYQFTGTHGQLRDITSCVFLMDKRTKGISDQKMPFDWNSGKTKSQRNVELRPSFESVGNSQ